MPRVLQIGGGSLNKVGAVLQTIGDIHRPLIVTDATMVKMGVVERLTAILTRAGYSAAVFDHVTPDPTDAVVRAGIRQFKSGNHDCVVGIGGGSPLDAAKAIAVMSRHGDDLLAYRPPKEFNEPGYPLVAVPTTAGTGSEVTHHTVLIHSETREKISCRGEAFMPTAAIIDYELTLSKPGRLTADNAIDTLTHAIEAYVSRKRTLFSDRVALDSMRLVGTHIERAYFEPSDEDARAALMLSATFGGMAFSNASIGLVHAMSRPLGSKFHVPHGMSNAMLLEEVTRFSLDAAQSRYADCARAVGFARLEDDDAAAATKLIDGIAHYNEMFSVPSIRDFGIDLKAYEAEIENMADEAIASGSPNNNPRIPTRGEVIEVYREISRK